MIDDFLTSFDFHPLSLSEIHFCIIVSLKKEKTYKDQISKPTITFVEEMWLRPLYIISFIVTDIKAHKRKKN